MIGRHIPKELKEMALSMSLQGLRDLEIPEYIGVSVPMLKKLRSAHRTGDLFPPPPIDRGRPRMLTAVQVKVRIQYLSPECCPTPTVPP